MWRVSSALLNETAPENVRGFACFDLYIQYSSWNETKLQTLSHCFSVS
jgi:hypothetical protein